MNRNEEALSAARALREQLGDITGVDVMHNCVLVAIYQRPEKTRGGIILAEVTRDEDAYQSKVGLVIKTGPLAFKEDARTDFGGKSIAEGDWVLFRVSDSWSVSINKVPCRMLDDVKVRAIVPDPTLIW